MCLGVQSLPVGMLVLLSAKATCWSVSTNPIKKDVHRGTMGQESYEERKGSSLVKK